jgi:hypothetical protein
VPPDVPASAPAELPPLAAEDHVCAGCGIAYAEVSLQQAVETIQAIPAAARAAAATVPEPAAGRRPEPGVWSVAEYLCHLRDVYVTFTVRLHRARREDGPRLDPMYNDLRAQRFGYARTAADAVLTELAAAAEGFCAEVADTAPSEWDRKVTRLPGEDRTARWLVRQAMHEGVHHVRDVERVGRAVAEGGRS